MNTPPPELATEQDTTLDNVRTLVESPLLLEESPLFESPTLIYSHDTLNNNSSSNDFNNNNNNIDTLRPIAGQMVDFTKWKQRSLSLDMTFVRQQGSQPAVTQLDPNCNTFETSPRTPTFEHLYAPRVEITEFSNMENGLSKHKKPKMEKQQKKLDEKLDALLDRLSISLNALEENANTNATNAFNAMTAYNSSSQNGNRSRSNSKSTSTPNFEQGPTTSNSPRCLAIKNNAFNADHSSNSPPTQSVAIPISPNFQPKNTPEQSTIENNKDNYSEKKVLNEKSPNPNSSANTTAQTTKKKTSETISLVQEVLKLYQKKMQLLVQDRNYWTNQLMTIRDSVFTTFDPSKKFKDLKLVTAGSPFEMGFNYIDDPFTVQKSPEREILVYDMKAREEKKYPLDPKYFEGLPLNSKNNCLIRTDNSDGYRMCSLSKKPEKDCKSKVENSFTMKILKTKRSNIIVGIIPSTFDFEKHAETVKSIHPGHSSNKFVHPSYGFSCSSERYSSKGTFNHFGEQFFSGDTLTFFYNSVKKTIELWKNEESLGIMFSDVDQTVDYLFVVCLKDEGDSVVLV